jgi:hypothetical protein
MPKRSSKSKKPEDVNVLAASIVQAATRTSEDQSAQEGGKNPAAVALGRLGGLKGGKARAGKLSVKRRKAIAKAAAEARWRKSRP